MYFHSPKRHFKKPAGQVAIAWNNPLAKGLQGLAVPNELDFNFVGEIESGVTLDDPRSSYEFVDTAFGRALTSTVDDVSITSNKTYPGVGFSGDYAIFAHIYNETNASNFSYIIALENELGIAVRNTNVLYVHDGETVAGLNALEDKKYYSVVGTRVNGVTQIYVDGVLEASKSSTRTVNDGRLVLLSYNQTQFSKSYGRHVLLAGYSTRGWSADDVRLFYENPYQLLSPLKKGYVLGGSAVITGTGDLQSQAASASGSGSINGAIDGSGSLLSDNAQIFATGIREITAQGAIQAGPFTFEGTGERIVNGAGDISSQPSTLSGAGDVSGAINGIANLLSDVSTLSGIGVREITGTGAVQAGSVTFSGIGDRVIVGQGVLLSDVASLSGSGSINGAIDGSGSLLSDNAQISAAGIREVTAQGAIQAGPFTFTGTGDRIINSIADISSQAAILSGVGTTDTVVTGSGTLISSNSQISGTGFRQIIGSGTLLSGEAFLTGTASKSITGFGALQSAPATLVGLDISFMLGNARQFKEFRKRVFVPVRPL